MMRLQLYTINRLIGGDLAPSLGNGKKYAAQIFSNDLFLENKFHFVRLIYNIYDSLTLFLTKILT